MLSDRLKYHLRNIDKERFTQDAVTDLHLDYVTDHELFAEGLYDADEKEFVYFLSDKGILPSYLSDGKHGEALSKLYALTRYALSGEMTEAVWNSVLSVGIGCGLYTKIAVLADPERYIHYDQQLKKRFEALGHGFYSMDLSEYQRLLSLCGEIIVYLHDMTGLDIPVCAVRDIIMSLDIRVSEKRLLTSDYVITKEQLNMFTSEKGSMWYIEQKKLLSDKLRALRNDSVADRKIAPLIAELTSLYNNKAFVTWRENLEVCRDLIVRVLSGTMGEESWNNAVDNDIFRSVITELLCYLDPDRYVYLTKDGTERFGLRRDYTWDEYLWVCARCSELVEQMRSLGLRDADMIDVSRYLKFIGKIDTVVEEASGDDTDSYLDIIMDDVDPEIHLDEEQRDAVLCDDKYLLLVACAGSGKTTTIAAKTKYLIMKKNVDPKKILITSFTAKAVADIRDMIQIKLKLSPEIRTFHSNAYQRLRGKKDKVELETNPEKVIRRNIRDFIPNNERMFNRLLVFFKDHLYQSGRSDLTISEIDGMNTLALLTDFINRYEEERLREWISIRGDQHISYDEAKVANFLFRNGIEYSYRPVPGEGNEDLDNAFYLHRDKMTVILECTGVHPSHMSQLKMSRYRKMRLDYIEFVYSNNIESDLKHLLIDHGFRMDPMSNKDIYRELCDTDRGDYFESFAVLASRFISLMKVNNLRSEEIDRYIEEAKDIRSRLFLEITKKIFIDYQRYLESKDMIDYDDMICMAYDDLLEMKRKGERLDYQYIIVDEYQDIAAHRSDYINILADISDAKIVAVGDDWQSIYSFAGSKVSYFLRFRDEHPGTSIKTITRTYRNSQELIDIAGSFIMKNCRQMEKQLTSNKHLSDPIYLVHYDNRIAENKWVNLVSSIRDTISYIVDKFGKHQRILIITRYSFEIRNIRESDLFTRPAEEEDRDRIVCKDVPDADITILNAHRSKGLTFDQVIIASASDEKFGFPSKVEDDPVFRFILKKDESLPYAEERRLFYVALTRTRNHVYILAPIANRSVFVDELVKDYGIMRMPDIETPEVGRLQPYRTNQDVGVIDVPDTSSALRIDPSAELVYCLDDRSISGTLQSLEGRWIVCAVPDSNGVPKRRILNSLRAGNLPDNCTIATVLSRKDPVSSDKRMTVNEITDNLKIVFDVKGRNIAIFDDTSDECMMKASRQILKDRGASNIVYISFRQQ